MTKINRTAATIAALMLAGSAAYGQVAWQFSAVKKSDSLVEIHVKAVLAEGWHLYPADSSSSPFPTQVFVLQGQGLRTKGQPRELGRLTAADGVRYYTGTAEFVQTLLYSGNVRSAEGTVQFVICTAERCLAPEKKEFVVKW